MEDIKSTGGQSYILLRIYTIHTEMHWNLALIKISYLEHCATSTSATLDISGSSG